MKVDGTFMFESNLANNDPSITNTAIVGGIFYDKAGNVQTGGGAVSIGSNQMQARQGGTYGFDKVLPQAGLYGTNVTFSLQPPSGSANSRTNSDGSSGIVKATVYSPAPIYIKNVPPMTSVTLVPNTTTTLTWNADPNDTTGVVVIAEFIPTRYINKSVLSEGYSTVMEGSMLVPDNGSTVIPWSFFANYPSGGHIILWVARGNYAVVSKGTYSYKVGGYTAAAVWDVLVPYPPVVDGFIPNGSGWSATNTNISNDNGLVTCSLTLNNNSFHPADYTVPFLVGTITGCIPTATRTLFIKGPHLWGMTVDASGNVYFQFLEGNPPPQGTILNPMTVNGTYNQ